MSTAAKRKKDLVGKSTSAIDANDASEQGTRKPKAEPKAKPKEKRGVGTKDTSSIDKNIEKVKSLMRTAAGSKNLKKAQNLAGRLKALIAIRNSDA